MIVDCIGCLHGAKPDLEGGDLLIVTGDLTVSDEPEEYLKFYCWLHKQKYKKYIVIAGNHDNLIQAGESLIEYLADTVYLCDSGTEFEGLKIWGTPWTSRFEGINPLCCAFTGADDDEIAPHFELIPPDVDILITHGPPFAIRDMTKDGKQVGSVSLMAQHICRLRPKLWVFSHIHEGYGKDGPYEWSGTTYVNCSIMNEKYQPINKPIRIEL
jgi:Icc-related predicted phosphoesterase